MRVAIVSFYLMESTIPLSKYLTLEGHDIDLFCVLPHSNQNTYVVDFLKNKQPIGFVSEIVTHNALGGRLWNYLEGVTTKFFIFPDGRFERLFLRDLYYAFKLANRIKKNKHDLIHIIHTSRRFWLFFYFFMPKRKIIQTLHEVTSHEGKTPFLVIQKLKWLIRNSTPIIFHSEISKTRFMDFRNAFFPNKRAFHNFKIIKFGLFETYHCFSDYPNEVNKKDNIVRILNFGRIVPSKGIHFLVDAVKLLQNSYPIHLTIAGEGEPYFDLSEIKNYEFINRLVTNKEIVTLIKECDVVVLPYISASQSGIPMTAFAFNKPIIASNIDAFKEVIDDFETGILVTDVDKNSLAKSIEMFLLDDSLKSKMEENIKNKYSTGSFSWTSIAAETVSFYEKQIKNSKIKRSKEERAY